MNAKRIVWRNCNALLERVGLCLNVLSRDFDARLENPLLVERMLEELCRTASSWIHNQEIFDVRGSWSLTEVNSFYLEYLDSPFRATQGGSRFNNLLWLFFLSRAYSPSVIVDSGTYQGASAWALRKGSLNAPLYSYDIDLSRLRHRVNATYIEADWTTHEIANDCSRGLCYFDDHVDQVSRLLQAKAAGFPIAVFDDDFSVNFFAQMANENLSLPKIEFTDDDSLRNESELIWSRNGITRRWKVDVDYLDQGKNAIERAQRLPDTSTVTGIFQLPYKVIKIAQ